jgi:flagellar protein FliT
MTTIVDILAYYERMAGASQQMLRAARAADWDTVDALERDCAALIAELKTLGDTGPLGAAQSERKATIIRGLLADDAEIRNLAQPRLAELAALMESSSNQRKLGRAYDN